MLHEVQCGERHASYHDIQYMHTYVIYTHIYNDDDDDDDGDDVTLFSQRERKS